MKRALVMLPLILMACGKNKGPIPPPTNPDPPVIRPDSKGATCADACAHLGDLGCDAAKPTPNGVPCTEVCAALPVKLPCLASVTSCEQTSACWE